MKGFLNNQVERADVPFFRQSACLPHSVRDSHVDEVLKPTVHGSPLVVKEVSDGRFNVFCPIHGFDHRFSSQYGIPWASAPLFVKGSGKLGSDFVFHGFKDFR